MLQKMVQGMNSQPCYLLRHGKLVQKSLWNAIYPKLLVHDIQLLPTSDPFIGQIILCIIIIRIYVSEERIIRIV
jgi:hypothetical protein